MNMPVDCQRFYSLVAFAEKGFWINFDMIRSKYVIIINRYDQRFRTSAHQDPDSAMSEALRWLRKQNKQ